MVFHVDTAELLNITDLEIAELLSQVFVEGGYTEQEVATSIFDPSVVRKRGKMLGARERKTMILAGIVIIVPPNSPARVLAQGNDVEMHLLSVKPEYRRQGLGRILVKAGITYAKESGYTRMILWTQPTMNAAHHLYESAGFIRSEEKDFSRDKRDFLVYERTL